MKCVLITTKGERVEGAEELHRLGYSLEVYPSTKNEEMLADTRVDEFIPFIHRHPETTERHHVRSLRASFIRMLEDSRYDDDDLVIFAESDAFPLVDANRLREALQRELEIHPETDLFRLFHNAVWEPTGEPDQDAPIAFEPFATGEIDANSPYVWGTHALVIPRSKRKKISAIFRTYRLPTDIALEAANSNGDINIRAAQHNLFYQHHQSGSGKNKKIAICLSSYKRLTDLQRQLWCMMDQSYPDIHVFAAIKGITESTYHRIVEPLFSHFVQEGRLTMRLYPNKNQLSNFIDTIRNLDLSEYDLFAKVDDDDVYGRDYFKIINDVHQMLPDDFSSYYCGVGGFIHQKSGVNIVNDGWYSCFGPTLVCGRSAMQKIIACEREPERIGEICPRLGHSGYGYTEDNLMHILMEETGAINREPYIRHQLQGLHISIQCSNASVMRGGLVDGDFRFKNHVVAHGREHEEHVLEIRHPEWHDIIRISGTRAKRLGNHDEASVVSRTERTVILKWDLWDTEYFTREPDGLFHYWHGLPSNENNQTILLPEERKKVAVLFIATGRYIVFWEKFHTACRQYFLSGHDVHYFLFTDHADTKVADDTTIVPKKFLSWPMETLRRFETFLSISNELKEYDYIYFLNGNLLPVAPIKEEIFPSSIQEIMVACHPGFYRQPRNTYTYDRNPMSEACIHPDQGEIYVAGGFNGGTAQGFLQMCHELSTAVKRDLDNGIIALWHDESHLNKYILGRSPLVLTPEYIFPESITYPYEHLSSLKKIVKMVLQDKTRPVYGGLSWLRQTI